MAREARRNGLQAAVEKESLWGAWKMWKMWDAGSWWEEAAKEFAMVTRTMLDGEQFGWGAVSG